ncbi:protein SHORT ROOT IN SALT MEDIUM 1-like [Magnolia sinica]|uniref:protein SHORT ROOT IN SALT MEDIUM 1-like n=1 Tax=Magnolia sinica TaxID=86752 RepID=UPI002658903D|nr:protein SHORT ROOT IN SALT MEDIUM 1-like [Magnolia sinica]
MSGISSHALEELCSDKSSDRIPHLNIIPRFAILRKDCSFMAIGGPWNAAQDGGDPLVDDSSLVQSALRHVKDLTQLDLRDSQHWNRFLEAGNDEDVADLQGKHDKETTDGIKKMEEPTDEVKSEDKTAETNEQ